jgi:hypothetical protein
MNLKDVLAAIHESVSTSSAEEIRAACRLIVEAQAMTGAERDCIEAGFKHGPLFDGDVPSKSGRDSLINKGFMVKVVVKGEDGYNAITYKGAQAYRLFQVGV